MQRMIKISAIHWTAAAALTIGGLPLVAQPKMMDAPPPAPLQGPGMDGGPMTPHRPPMERAFRMGPRGRWWNDPEISQKLGLSTDQQKKMDDIFLQSRLKLIDEHAAVEKEEAILEPLLSAEQPDETRILAQIDKVAQSRAELEKANARMLLGLRGVLTTAQWKTLQTLGPHDRFDRHDGRRPHARDGRGPDGPPNGGEPAPPPPGASPGSAASQ